MGFSKPQPRHGCDAFGPGAVPRRAVTTPTRPWRRHLAALVVAGGMGAMGMGITPAAAAGPAESAAVSSSTRNHAHHSHGEQKQHPRRAQASGDQEYSKQKPRRAASSSTSSGSASATGSATSSSSSSTSTSSSSSNTSTATSAAASAATSATATNASAANGASSPLASGTYTRSAVFGATGNWSRYHTGQDFSASTGTPVYAVVSGTVISGNVGSWAGNYVAIRAADGSSTLYAHLNNTNVRVGQQVTAGQQIGTVGNTGRSFGSHLHFEYYPSGTTPGDVYSATNPMKYLNALNISM